MVEDDERREAQDPNTPEERLRELSQRGGQLALLVARNLKATPSLLEQLASPKQMLSSVMYNPPVTVMTAWYRPDFFEWNQEPDVRRAVASHPNAPTPILLKLALHFPDEVSRNAALPLILLGSEWLRYVSAPIAERFMRHPGLAEVMGGSLRASGLLPE